MVRHVVFGHGEESAVEVDEAGVGYAHAVAGVDEAEESAGVEEEEPGDAGVAMELADSFREDRSTERPLLDEPVRIGEPAGVAGGAVVEFDGVDHAVAVEEVVAGYRLVMGVGAVPDVDAVNAIGDFSGQRKAVPDGLLRHGSKVSGYLDSRVSGFRKRVAALVGYQGGLRRVERRRSRSLQEVPLLLFWG